MATKRKPVETAAETVQETKEAPEVTQEEPAPAGAQPPADLAAETAIEEGTLIQEYAVRKRIRLYLREKPGKDALVIAVLPGGAGVFPDGPLEGDPEWVHVRTGLLSGWVMAEFLEPLPVSEI